MVATSVAGSWRDWLRLSSLRYDTNPRIRMAKDWRYRAARSPELRYWHIRAGSVNLHVYAGNFWGFSYLTNYQFLL
jgi:hypothetical protein